MIKLFHYVINNYKSRNKNNSVHLVFDHMFSNDNYTVFMITMELVNKVFLFGLGVLKEKVAVMLFKKNLLKKV